MRFVKGHNGRRPFDERFWEKVDERDPDECWEWIASRDQHGYGFFMVGYRGRMVPRKAHRIAWELTTTKEIPEGLCLLHRCDNPGCVNPSHMFIGTMKDNTQDMIRKGRNSNGERLRTGEANPWSRLTEDDVHRIRRMASQGYTHRQIALEIGATPRNVKNVVTRRTWRHVP